MQHIRLGQKLRKLRFENGYSQEYIAQCLNLSQKTISNMENDKTTITLNTLKKISNELDVDLLELLSESKVVVQHNNSHDTSTFNGVVNNIAPEELILQLKERIEDLKNQLKLKDELIVLLKK
uniref:helix-turn-helix transcriptional regulator n=1 Tax=Flavobacterium sp. TaxID=239 RepID=UPI00404A7419